MTIGAAGLTSNMIYTSISPERSLAVGWVGWDMFGSIASKVPLTPEG